MNRNPAFNALAALAYILAVALFMSHAKEWIGPDSIITGAIFLSLFVFSAAVMGYLFLAEPIQRYLDGQKKEAIAYFLKTLLTFGVCLVALIGIGAALS